MDSEALSGSISTKGTANILVQDLNPCRWVHYLQRDKPYAMHTSDWLVVLFNGVSTHFGSFNAELCHFDKNFKQFSLV